MIRSSCGVRILCGISSRFQLLFPSYRQVAHALLTRPPLTSEVSKLSSVSVRLECVMHAASVHPEPGSNSLKFCISFRALRDYSRYLISMDNCFRYTPTRSVKLSYLRALILAFSALWFIFQMNCRVFWLYLFQVTGITARPSLCTFPLLLFNFQGPSLSRFRLRSLAATRLVYHFLCSLSSTFFKFFQNFFPGALATLSARSSAAPFLTLVTLPLVLI